MSRQGIFILLFTSLLCCCNNTQTYEPTFNPEHQRIIAEFEEAIKQNQITADSIASVINQEYNYSVPIRAQLDRKYRQYYGCNNLELFLFDVPYYGLCNQERNEGFIFSLHSPDRIIDIHIFSFKDEYVGYGNWLDYNIKFK